MWLNKHSNFRKTIARKMVKFQCPSAECREAINMIKKGQVKNLNYSVLNKVKYINQLFEIGVS